MRFTNALGAVHYSRAVVADAEGNRTPVATSFANNSIEIRVPAAFLATATFPVTIDPVTTTFGVSTLATDDDTQPDIAYEATSDVYQVCWERAFSSVDHDVYSQLQNASGITIPGSTVTIDFTSDYWARPRTASNAVAAQFLVAAEVGAPGGGTRIIKGRTRDACSTTTGSQFQISDPVITSDQFDVDVGGDPTLAPPTYYCVTWERIFSSTDHDIFARLVLSNSTLLGTSTIFVDNTSGTLDEHPAVSKSDGSAPFTTQEWSIVWQRQFSPTDHDIRGAQIHWDGTITNASFSIDFSGSDDTLPTVSSEVDGASGTRNYLAAWQRQFSPDKDIEGAALNGAALLGEADISVLEGAFSSQDQILPSADSDGSGFAVAYSELYQTSTTDYDVYIAALSVSGGIISLVEGHQNLAFTSNPEVQAQVTSRHSGGGEASCYSAVWDENNAGQGDVLGGIYGTPGSGPASITSYCFPGSGGVIACPCANPGGAGSGCDNSIATGGGLLTATGVASLSGDTLVFTQSGELSSSLSIILQGDTNLCFGTLFGDGVRCVGGNLKRLYVHSAAGGVVSGPVGVDPSVSARSAALGDTIAACTTRAYQVYYRDPNLGFCPAGFNVGNALRVLWGM